MDIYREKEKRKIWESVGHMELEWQEIWKRRNRAIDENGN
jgi:hypothetical protein